MKFLHIILAGLMSLCFEGCVPALQSGEENLLNVKVISGNMSTPLSVHFFTLKSDNVFKRLDYFELVDSKHINWNNELLGHTKTLLLPGHTEIFQVPVSTDMQYYALVIGFKDVKDNDNWRYLRQVPPGGANIALRLSQEGDGATAVQRVSSGKVSTSEKYTSSRLHKVGKKVRNKISTGIEKKSDSIIDRSTDHLLGHIFTK